MLFHNAKGKNTLEALERIITDLKAQGYQIVPVSEILLKGRHLYRQGDGRAEALKPLTGADDRPRRREVNSLFTVSGGHKEKHQGRILPVIVLILFELS